MFFSSHWLILFTNNIKPKSVKPLKKCLVIMCCWNKVCGAEKMTDNSQEIRPDMNPIPQRQVLAAVGWEGRAVFDNHR